MSDDESLRPLTRYIREARQQWTHARPKMVQQMQAEGTLEAALDAAAERRFQVEQECLSAGLHHDQTAELAAESWILPMEEDVPELGGPMVEEDDPTW